MRPWLLAACFMLLCLLVPGSRGELAQVHIDHSVAARDLLTRSSQAARSNPAQATALLDELLDRHADELVECEPGLYVSASLVAREQVSHWPATALEHLQQAWEPRAAEQWPWVADSPDFATVDRFARRYFFTSAGALAAERAAQLALEAGQVDLARRQLNDLLAFHPRRDNQTGHWQTLQAAALRLGGQEAASRQALQAAQSQPAGASHAPPPGRLAQKVESLKPLPASSPLPADLDEKAKLAVLWQANLTDRASYAASRQKVPPHWLAVPVALSESDLIVTQFDRHCFAFDRTNGTMVWDYYPLNNRMATRAGISGPTGPRRPAVAQGRVYSIADVPLPQEEAGPITAVQSLACLDAATGRPYWVRGVGEITSHTVPTNLDGTPVVAGDRLYVAARTARTSVYNEVFLLQIDTHTGNLLGRTHLFGLGRVEQTPADRIKPVRLGVHGGILYVASPAGAVAALDVNSLRPIWLRSFKPQTVTDAKDADVPEVREPNVPAFWADEPLILDDRVILPADASLQVLNRWTGQILQSIALDGPVSALSARPGASGQVAAIVKRYLYLVDITLGTTAQRIDLGRPPEAIGGLAPLSGGCLLICAEDQLRVLQPDAEAKGLPVGLLPAGIPLVAQGRVYLGGNGSLACVTDGEKPLATLRQEMKTSDSPLIALRTGELALRLDQPDLAIQTLRAALQRGAADVSRAGQPAVQQLFDTCLTFARQYGKKRGPDAQRIAEQLLDIAGQCPSQPDEKIQLCAALADLRLARKDPAEAIAAWQSILADETLRTAPLPEPLGGREGTLAGTWARTNIEDTIQRQGRSAYSRFDDEAAKLLQTGQAKQLDDILQHYPNSKHVPAALLRLGQNALASDTKVALDSLRKAAALSDAASPVRAQAMLDLARAYEKLGNLQAAATWMARLASESPDMRVERAGHSWTAKQYAADVVARLPRSTPSPFHIDLPLQPGRSRTLDDTVCLLNTPSSAAEIGPGRPTLIWSAGSLQAVDSQTDQPAWQQPLKFETQPTLLAADEAALIFHDRYRVTAISPLDGRTLWTWQGQGPDPHGPDVDPESVPTIQAAAATADSILVFTAGGAAACLDRANGMPRWQGQPQPVFVAGLAVCDDLAVYRAARANTIVYRVLEVRTGRDVTLFKPSRDVPAESVEILPAAMVMLVGTSAIEGYDAYSGALVWQATAKSRFVPSASLRRDTAVYIADGERHLVKIDVLTGDVLWRAVVPPRTRASVRVLATGPSIWDIDERGVHTIDDVTGKVIQTVVLPPEIAPHLEIRSAALCDAGVLCLAAKRQGAGTSPDIPPAVLALFTCRDNAADVSILARLTEATGLVSGLDVSCNAVVVAAGNKVITLRGQAKVSR